MARARESIEFSRAKFELALLGRHRLCDKETARSYLSAPGLGLRSTATDWWQEMGESASGYVVVVVRKDGVFRWFRSDRDLWVLDVNKWRNEFIKLGYSVPEFKDDYRFGIAVVDRGTASSFLHHMSRYEVPRDQLSIELATRFKSANSWWDVSDLFPIMFVDFDAESVAAFYLDGAKMERYLPDGWKGQFIDFATEFSEEIFPESEKFWVKGGSDLLKLLNERAARNESTRKHR